MRTLWRQWGFLFPDKCVYFYCHWRRSGRFCACEQVFWGQGLQTDENFREYRPDFLLVVSLVLGGIGLLLGDWIMEVLNTPENIMKMR